jgi:hypothetical protein
LVAVLTGVPVTVPRGVEALLIAGDTLKRMGRIDIPPCCPLPPPVPLADITARGSFEANAVRMRSADFRATGMFTGSETVEADFRGGFRLCSLCRRCGVR